MPSCYAYGCSNSNTKEECRGVRFFRIPPAGRQSERRRRWLNAIRRQGEPYQAARICSAHFISGAPSAASDKENPDYVPSLFNFPASHQTVGDAAQKQDRYKRLKSRTPLSSISTNAVEIDIVAATDSESEGDPGEAVEASPGNRETDAEEVITSTSVQTEGAQKKDAETNTEGSHPESLRSIISALLEKNELLEQRCAALETENKALRAEIEDCGYGALGKDEEKHAFYTGLPSVASYMFLIRVLVIAGFTRFRTMTLENTLLVLLLKLRLGLKNKDIGYRLGVSYTHVSTIISSKLPILACVCRTFIRWPTREAVIANMPNCFRSANSTIRRTRVIVDCFEINTERPNSLKPRAQLWSNYKHHSTVKFLIGISPMGSVSFLSDAWGGRASDKVITLDSHLVELLEPPDVVMADRGFLVKEEFALYGIKVIMPHFSKGRQQMTQKEIQESRSLSRVRIHVERVIGRLRRQFQILNMTLPVNLVPQVDNIVTVCAGLINLHRSVV